MSSVQLTDLLTRLPARATPPALHGTIDDVTIHTLTQDSRQAAPGVLFAALHGSVSNGEDYIDQAIAQGAAAILCADHYDHSRHTSIPFITHPRPAQLLAQLAATFYQPQPSYCVAVTGTDGKTSTAEFVRQLWELRTLPALSVGTMGLRSTAPLDDMPAISENTSPEPVGMHHALHVAALQGVLHVACETSSHGLNQYRCDGLTPNAAIFTSFSQDHLDYHANMEEYFAAKARLFHELLQPDGVAILCKDYPAIAELEATLRADKRNVVTYGTSPDADIIIRNITSTPDGQYVSLTIDGTDCTMNVPIYGDFQIYNIIAALLAVCHTTQEHMLTLLPLCERLTTIRGRLERIGAPSSGARIFVDYAHTPGALEKALTTLRPYVSHKLHVVFGCGGDRDKAKRPLMGRAADIHADSVIITDDNPRTEDATTIRKAIHAACPSATVIADRRDAITHALSTLQQGDILLIAGKGHEDYQIIGTTKHHLDDVEIVTDWVGEQL